MGNNRRLRCTNRGNNTEITEGKLYEVEETSVYPSHYLLMNDLGWVLPYYKWRFTDDKDGDPQCLEV